MKMMAQLLAEQNKSDRNPDFIAPDLTTIKILAAASSSFER